MTCNLASIAMHAHYNKPYRYNFQYILFVCLGLKAVHSPSWDKVINPIPDRVVFQIVTNIKAMCEVLISGIRYHFLRE